MNISKIVNPYLQLALAAQATQPLMSAVPGTGESDGIPITGVPGNTLDWDSYKPATGIYDFKPTTALETLTQSSPQQNGVAVTYDTSRIVPGQVAPPEDPLATDARGQERLIPRIAKAIDGLNDVQPSRHYDTSNIGDPNVGNPVPSTSTEGNWEDATYSSSLPFEMVVSAKKLDKPIMSKKQYTVNNMTDWKNAYTAARAAGFDQYTVIENGKEKTYSTLKKGETATQHRAAMAKRREFLKNNPETVAQIKALYPDFNFDGDYYGSAKYGNGRGSSWGDVPGSKKTVTHDNRGMMRKGASKGVVQNGKPKRYGKHDYSSKAKAKKHMNGGTLTLIPKTSLKYYY